MPMLGLKVFILVKVSRTSYHIYSHILFFLQQVLKLRSQPIREIEEGAFIGLHRLTRLHLYKCGLTEMPPLSPVKDSLKTLWLQGNLISAVDNNYFNGFGNIYLLDLSRNCLNVYPNVSFPAKQLQSLWLSGNKIRSLKPFLTSTIFAQFMHLDVSYNEIYTLNFDMISHWPELRVLHIGGNLFTTLGDLSDFMRGAVLKVGQIWYVGEEFSCDALEYIHIDIHFQLLFYPHSVFCTKYIVIRLFQKRSVDFSNDSH